MPANTDTKYSEKEFTILKLKKERKYGADYATADLLLDDPRAEMNQLILSEPEDYAAGSEDSDSWLNGQSANKFNDDLDSEEFEFKSRKIEKDFENNKNSGKERSLMSEWEGRARLISRKAKEAKINNSFTGPYPIDPTDFNHNDKGANAQFLLA